MDETPSRVELSPVGFLRRSAAVFPNKVAVVAGERRYRYAERAGRVNRFAAALRAQGLERGDRVAVLCPNSPALLEAHFAVPAAGGVLVAINTRLTQEEVGSILRHSGARVLVADAELRPLAAPDALAGVEVVTVDDRGGGLDSYEAFLAGAPDTDADDGLADAGPLHEDDPIAINYTSGTTGRPKGAVYTHRGAYLRALGNVLETRLDRETVYLWTLPMFHCNGWGYPWAVTAVAGRHVCLRKVDYAAVWELLEQEGVTHYCGAPTVHINVVNHPAAHRLAQPVTVPPGGAPPSPTLLAQMQRLNLHPIHLYGLTETYGPHMGCPRQPEWDALPVEEQAALGARQGVPCLPLEETRVVDAGLRDVPRDGQTIGEVVARGNAVMREYFREPDLTAEAFRGGWFHTGDLGVWHPDGYVELRDRAKDIIISGGENISTIEVEQAIARHPAVLDVAVVATPDETWGERPKAYVELKPEASATAEEIIAFSRQHLAGFKRPAGVEFGELPRTSTGKIQKYLLRQRERER